MKRTHRGDTNGLHFVSKKANKTKKMFSWKSIYFLTCLFQLSQISAVHLMVDKQSSAE